MSLYIILKYAVVEASSAPVRSSRAPLFLEGALVRTIPDTRPGIGPEDSVATYGTVAEARAEGVKSVHIGRSGPWVSEERVVETSNMLPAHC